jgi:hypothetical protein
MTLVGAARNARQLLVWPVSAEVFVPAAQNPKEASAPFIKAPRLTPEAVRQIVLRELASVDPGMPPGDFLTQDRIVEMVYPNVMIWA